MKINCGPSPEAKYHSRKAEEARLKEWHDFYAIWPRRVGENDCRFFEMVERKGEAYRGLAGMDFPVMVTKWRWQYRSKA